MPPNINRIPKSASIESKEKARDFKELFAEAINPAITTENIDTFADTALNDLVILTEKVVAAYKNEHPKTALKGKELEDEAFKKYKVTDLGTYLDLVSQKIAQLNRLDAVIEAIPVIPEVITPPDEPNLPLLPGQEAFNREKELIPRLKLLLYILETDFHFQPTPEDITKGIVTERMFRQESYVTVLIEQLERLVQVCDEEGNASYVFDTAAMRNAGVKIEVLNRATKDEKNRLIAEHAGLGARVIQSEAWRERISELLSDKILENKNGEQNKFETSSADIPMVERSEFSPWRGFHAESEEKHWGTIGTIVKRLCVSRPKVENYIEKNPDSPSLQVTDLVGHVNIAYCFEDIRDAHRDFLALPKVASEGDWRGFLPEDKDGKHWGAVQTIADRLSAVSRRKVVNCIKKNASTKSQRASDVGGKEITAYCFEDIRDALKDFLALPKVASEGDWRGFLPEDEDGKHWSTIATIAERLGVSESKVRDCIIMNPNFSVQRASDVGGKEITAYCFEDIQEALKDFLTLPEVLTNGEWRGFLPEDEDGKHWGAIETIKDRLGVHRKKVVDFIKMHPNFSSLRVRDLTRKEAAAFCFEDIEAAFKARKS